VKKVLLLTLIFIFSYSCTFSQQVSRFIAANGDELDVEGKLPPSIKQFLLWEFYANQAHDPSLRGPQEFPVEHFEIPLSAVNSLEWAEWDEDIKESLIFERDGKKWIRWVINPEDNVFIRELEKFLESKNIPTTRHHLFTGYLTSSKSTVMYNPKNKAVFNLKVSTSKTGGPFSNLRRLDESRVRMARVTDEIFRRIQNVFDFKRLVILREPVGFHIGEIDQGLMVRSLAPLIEKKETFLPVFSVFDEELAKDLARLNGSDDVMGFWKEHMIIPLGEAMAEFQVFSGLSYNSPHAQQFGILLDENNRPTGKVAFRDLGDFDVYSGFHKKSNWLDTLNKILPRFIPFIGPINTKSKWNELLPKMFWEKKMSTTIGLFHGFDKAMPPKWILPSIADSDREPLRDWMKAYFRAFEKKFSDLSGVPFEDFSPDVFEDMWWFMKMNRGQQSTGYFKKEYKINSPEWESYLDYASCFLGQFRSIHGKKCSDFLSSSSNSVLKNYFRPKSSCAQDIRPILLPY
jgi:hypothetical protein